MEVYQEKRAVNPTMRFVLLPLSSIALQILTAYPTQEFVRQSHDQNQKFPLGQIN